MLNRALLVTPMTQKQNSEQWWEEEFNQKRGGGDESGDYPSNAIKAFIKDLQQRTREEALRDFREALLTEAHITDYADETEYDVMCRFLDKYAKQLGISLTHPTTTDSMSDQS